MRTPVILVNLKAYPEALGREAVAVARLAGGVAGTLLNHSERSVPLDDLEVLIPRCTKLGLEVVCCADDLAEAEAVARFFPDYVAIEPPELIGGGGGGTRAETRGGAGGGGGGRGG